MGRYKSASHLFYRCQYHLVWTTVWKTIKAKGNLSIFLIQMDTSWSNTWEI